ncbi:hypothetical protein GCM10022226_20280 [Sphaerisporangium flaviroseum]|uniref:Secreted protein n=1 Tax=Sphaerisporangium flaviroseum TaxID=509199 RepID=A0ABP7HNR5_9ACTN
MAVLLIVVLWFASIVGSGRGVTGSYDAVETAPLGGGVHAGDVPDRGGGDGDQAIDRLAVGRACARTRAPSLQ